MPSPTRVVAVHRYFWPDAPPYAAFLRAIAGRWAQDGARVTVLSAQPSYVGGGERRPRRELLGGFGVQRLPALSGRGRLSRLLDLAAFPLVAAARVLTMRGRPDLVMCSTVPQVTLGIAMALAARARRAAFVYHCMDIHPEIGRLSGDFAHPVVYTVLSKLDRATMRLASRIVVLSADMKAAVVARDPRLGDKVVVLNNFALPSYDAAQPSPLPPPEPGVLRVLFTGNVGRFQGLENLIAALDLVPGESPVELVIMGEGKAKEDLTRLAAARAPGPHRVVFLAHGSASAAKALMTGGHVGVVSLTPKVVRYAYPSKTATYAEAGLPLIVVVEPDSELASSVLREGSGWSVPPGDVAALARAMTEAARERQSGALAAKAAASSAYAALQFAPGPALDRWSALLDEIAGERTGTA